MRPIKFRGRAISDSCGVSVDKIVRGDLIHEWNKVSIFDDDDGDIYEIDPESIAQLVGYDANGREVYEGDTLIGASGDQWTAELVHAPVSDDGFQHIVDPEEFTLKEN